MGNYADRIDIWRGQTGNPGPGFCAICGDFGKLTKDHVPPKGCVTIANSTLHRLTMETSDHMLSRQGLRLQGGLRFQTICTKCNSQRLGSMFDPELKVFTNGMRDALTHACQQPVLPQYVQTRANLSLVARAVIGHILAAHAVSDTKIKLRNLGVSETLREFFLDPLAPFPTDWRMYCWPYFGKRRVILRNTGWMDTSLPNPGEKAFTGHLLKFSPVAFWLTYNPPSAFYFEGVDITPFLLTGSGDETISFNLRSSPHMSYPEVPQNHIVMLFPDDQTSVEISAPSRRKKTQA